MKNTILSLICSLFLTPGLLAHASTDPDVVGRLDLNKYKGRWFEIAHSHNWFQVFCESSTAAYSLRADGKVGVVNTCYRGGRVFETIEGQAWAPDSRQPAKLVVDFGFPWLGDYWVVSLDPHYQWAVVSGPCKRDLFILSRTAPIRRSVLQKILGDLSARGFDLSDLIYDQY